MIDKYTTHKRAWEEIKMRQNSAKISPPLQINKYSEWAACGSAVVYKVISVISINLIRTRLQLRKSPPAVVGFYDGFL